MKSFILRAFPYLLVFCVFTLPRLGDLGQYVTADEPLYLQESGGFYYALANGKFASTFRVIQPGIPTLWTGAAGYLLRFPAYRYLGSLDIADLHFKELLQDYQHSPLEMLAFSRMLMVLLNASLMLACYFFARRLFGMLPALIGFLILALDPFMFAHNRLLVTDGLLASFSFLSLLALLDFIWHKRKLALLVSGMAAGLACLTKTTGIVLILMIGLLAIWCAWREPGTRNARIKSGFSMLGLWLAAAIIVYIAFFPALWIDPLKILIKEASFSFESASGGYNTNSFFNGRVIPGGFFGWQYFYYYPLTFLWRTTPVVMLGVTAALALWKTYRDPSLRWSIVWLLLFCILFTGIMTLSTKKMDRYLTPIYPPLDLLAGVGLFQLVRWIQARYGGSLAKTAAYLVLVVALFWQGALLWKAYPYPLSYYNPMLGGPRRSPEVMMIGWGEGLDQAARFLNQQPGIENKKVLAWYGAVFNYHFDKWASSLPIRSDISDSWFNSMINSDYAVIYIHQRQRLSSARLLDYLADFPPIYTFSHNGIEYVRVYDLQAIRQAAGSEP